MAGDTNRVILIGRLTRDPELRQLNTGTSLSRFSIANKRIFSSQGGERQEETSFFNCIAWGRQAEVIHQYCQKGKQLAIEGRLRQNSWQDNDGKKHSSVEVVVEQFQFLASPSGQARDKAPVDSSAVSPNPAESEQQFQPAIATKLPPQEVNTAAMSEEVDDDVPF